MPSVPGDHAYDVVYRATADFSDLFAEVAAAKAAMEELKESTDETNSSSEDGAKASADAEEARTKAMQDGSKAAKEYQQQQLLLNKAENNGFNTGQEAKAFRDQDTQSLLQHNIQQNGGRTSPDQALQDVRNKTAALNNQNASLAEMRSVVDDSTQSLENAAKASGDLDKGLADVEEGSQEVKQALNDTGQALDDFSSKSKSAGSNATQAGSSLENIAAGANVAAKGINDVNQSLSESSKAFLEYQQAQKDANSALSQTPSTSLSGALNSASADVEEAMRAQAAATAAENLSRNNMSAESLAASADKNVSNNVSTGVFSAEALTGAKAFAEEVKSEVTPAVEEAESAVVEATNASEGLSSAFEASTAQGVVLSAAMADLDKKVDGLSKNLNSGFSSAFVKQLAGVVKDFGSVSKAASALDDPAAREWVTDTGKELDSLAMQLQETQRGIEGVGDDFEESGGKADNFGTLLGKVTSTSAVVLANNLDNIQNKLEGMVNTLVTGDSTWEDFSVEIEKTAKQLTAAQKAATALDDPTAKDAVGELNAVLEDLSVLALQGRNNLDVFKTSEDSASGGASNLGNVLEHVTNAAAVVLDSNLSGIQDKLDKMRASMAAGNSTWEDFANDIAKVNTQLTGAQKQATALGDPSARNAVTDLRNALNDLAVEALGSRSDLGVFKAAVDDTENSTKKLAAGVKDTKKAADDASSSYRLFANGLKEISVQFAALSAQTKAEGGGTGFLGFLGTVFGGGLSGISSGFAALASLAGSALPLVLGLALAIPALATGIVGLAGAVVGLVGALSPLVGFFATLLPVVLGMAEAAGVLYLAIEPLIVAVNQFRQATTKSGAAAALKGLSPVMQEAAKDIAGFVKALSGAKGALKGIDTEVFSPLIASLGQLKTVIKPVEEALNTMAGAVGKAIQPVLAGFVTFLDSSNFQTLTKAAAEGLVYFGQTVSNFLSTLGMIAAAAAPYTVVIAKWFDTFTKGMKAVTSATIANGGVSQFFQQMITALQEIGSIAYETGRTFDLWGSGLAPIGNFILVGIARTLKDIADAANKVNFSQWNTDIEKFLSGLDTGLKGIATLFAALINNKFLIFLGDVFTDIGHIATALAPIVKFFTDIVVGALPTMEKILKAISGVIVDILKPIDSFLDKVEQNHDAMKVLSGIFTALSSLVIAGSVLSFFAMLGGLAGKGFSGLIDLINKIPGINLPGGSGKGTGAVSGDATAITTNADANASRIVEAITGTASESGAGAAAGGAEGAAAIGATATIAGIVTSVLAFLGAGFLIYEVIHGIKDPNSTVAKLNKQVGNSTATAVLGPSNNLNWFGRTQRDDEHAVQSVGRAVTGGNSALNKSVGDFFTDNTAWEKASNTAIGNFFTDKSQWEKSANHAIDDFFTDNAQWEKSSNRAVGDFFSDNTQWEKAANHAIDDFFTGNTGWEKAATKSISGWFTSAGAWFMRDVYEPIEKWVTNDFVGFFTNSVARWFTDAGSWFMRDVYEPVKNWVTGDFVDFFTQSIPHWFSDVTTWFMRDVYSPVEKWVTKDIPGFFTSSIPNWFSGVWKEFQKNVVDPIGNWLTGTGSDSLVGFFEAGFRDALNAVITDVFNNGLIRILNDALGVVGLKIPKIPTFAGGGHVQGNLGESDTSDSVWAKLTPGEFVIRKRAAAALGPDTLAQLNQADRPGSLARHPAGHFAGGGLIGGAESVLGGLVSGAEGLVGDVASWASSFVSGALQGTFNDAYKAIVSPILNSMPSGTIPTGVAGLAAGSIKNAVDSFLGAQDTKSNAAATGALGGSIPSGGRKQIIVEALQAAGVAANQWPVWEAGLNTLVTRESGWNPNAVNRTDSNAAAGNPSKGLTQTTGTTFSEYHVAGTSDNILDPVANMAAAIEYIEARYGSITNVQQANANEPPKGYAVGGFVGDPTLGMGFAAGGAFGTAPSAAYSGLKSQAGMNADGRLSGPGVHVENLNITNPIPEQSGDSLQRAMTRLRVYNGRGN